MPDKDFLNSIKSALELQLEDEVSDYCIRHGMDLIEDHEILSKYYEYAKENLFA